MFGHVPQRDELALAESGQTGSGRDGDGLPGWSSVMVGGFLLRHPHTGHTAATIRDQLHELLAFIRTADRMPWDADDLRFFSGIVPYWAEWLKNGEGDGLMAEFKAEMDRLGAPDDQVAPNWRRIWGIREPA